MIKTTYQIADKNSLTAFMKICGSGYFHRNLSPTNYSLKAATLDKNVLHLDFEPRDTLPEQLRQGEHYMEFGPQQDLLVTIKTVLDQGDRKHVFYRVVDYHESQYGPCFRVRKYSMHTSKDYDDMEIAYRAGENDPPEDGLELVNTQYSTDHSFFHVYERGQ